MPYNIRMVSTYPPRRCGIGTFTRDLSNALSHFTSEVGYIRIAAIDNNHHPYNIPVDLIIDQYNPKSWEYAINDIISRSNESNNPTVVVLQHEYGLDPDDNGNDGEGENYVKMARTLTEKGLSVLVYLHTILEEPDAYQRRIVQQLARYSDGLIVTTESAIDILESDAYGIDTEKVKHIDHGIRMGHPSHYDRLKLKEEIGLKDRFLVTTLGLLSPGKGIEYGIRAYGSFIKESLTDAQRRKIIYLIAGQCHPEFVEAEEGKYYQEYQRNLMAALDDSEVSWCRVKDLSTTDFDQYDVVFLDSFLEDARLLQLYGATNVMVLPYLNMQQISSGILADTLGSGRVAIATKFMYALELIYSNKKCPPGMVIGRHARGILVDPGQESVEQIAKALDFLVFDEGKRLRMERQAQQRGYQMRWYNSAWALLQYIQFVVDKKNIVTGRGVKFTREKRSRYQRIRKPKNDDQLDIHEQQSDHSSQQQ